MIGTGSHSSIMNTDTIYHVGGSCWQNSLSYGGKCQTERWVAGGHDSELIFAWITMDSGDQEYFESVVYYPETFAF